MLKLARHLSTWADSSYLLQVGYNSRSIRSGLGRGDSSSDATLVDDNVAHAQVDRMKPVVIVAGVGPGIGTSIARAFGAEGFAIALLARDSSRLAKRHAEITAAGITAAPFIVDLADAAARLNVVERVRTWAGGDRSSLVYNASRCSRVRLISSTWLKASAR